MTHRQNRDNLSQDKLEKPSEDLSPTPPEPQMIMMCLTGAKKACSLIEKWAACHDQCSFPHSRQYNEASFYNRAVKLKLIPFSTQRCARFLFHKLEWLVADRQAAEPPSWAKPQMFSHFPILALRSISHKQDADSMNLFIFSSSTERDTMVQR